MKINRKSFSLCFLEKYFKKRNTLIFSEKPIRYSPWYLKILGFNFLYKLKVLDNPVLEGNSWKYQVKLEESILYWFKFKIKIYN